jgi:hypothetical protein
MRANYGLPLRAWLKEQCIEEIIDFGDLQIFQGATTYPCIIRITKSKPHTSFDVTQVKTLDFQNLSDYVKENHYSVNQSALDDNGWSLADENTQTLLEKINSKGVSLSEYVSGKIYYGIKTGLNEAFVIDKATRERLIAEDPRSAELIKPFLAGRDIKRYRMPVIDKYLIFIANGWTREKSDGSHDAWGWLKNNYPAITDYLSHFAEAAQKRYDKGEYWWELRACDYYDEFEKPKIMYLVFQVKPAFTFDEAGTYANNAVWITPKADKTLWASLTQNLAGL